MNTIKKLLKGVGTGGLYVGGGVFAILFSIVQFAVPAVAGLSMIWWAITLFLEGSIIWGLLVLLIGTPIAIGIASYAAIFLFFIGIVAAIIWGVIKLFGFDVSFGGVWDVIWLGITILVLAGIAFMVVSSLCERDWSRRHLNWTVVILWVTVLPLAFIIGGVLDVPEHVISWLIPLLILLPFTGWALKQKNRSLRWLLLFIIPFLWLVFLGLKNRSEQKALEAKQTEAKADAEKEKHEIGATELTEEEYRHSVWEIYSKEWATANREKQAQLNKRMLRWQDLMKNGWTPSQAYYKVMEEESNGNT